MFHEIGENCFARAMQLKRFCLHQQTAECIRTVLAIDAILTRWRRQH